MMNRKHAGIPRYFTVLMFLLIISVGILPVAAEPLANNRHIFIDVANDAGVKFNLDGAKYGGPSNTYYIKADGGGLNELHMTTDSSDAYGQVTTTSAQSGVFYITNTGGRGFDNDIVLLIAVRGPVRDDFSVTIKSSGYTWTPAASGAYTPSPPTDYSHVTNAVSETFTKADLIYGAQNWKPGPGALGDLSLPIYNGQDMTNTSDQFLLMFVDLKAGNMYPSRFPGASLTDNGAVKVEYSFSQLDTFASFNGYGWCIAANQNQGISWTNPTRDFVAEGGAQQSGQSGFAVNGVPSSSSSSYSEGGGGAGLPVSGSAAPVNPALYGYKGKTVSTFKTGTLNGSVRFFSDPDSQPVIVNNRIREFNLSVDLPPGSNITLARMYMYITGSHNLQTRKGVIPSFYATLNTEELKPDQVYVDTDGDDNGHVAATYAYDVRELLKGNGTYIVSVRNLDFEQFEFTIDGLLLVTAYENETAPATSYWIDEGCDVILSLPEKGLLPDDCETRYSFSGTVNMSTAGNASLYLVSTGLDQDNTTEHAVSFNEGKWYNLFDNRSASIVLSLPVLTYLNETGNTADIQSTIRSQDADYLVNRNAILIVEHQDPNSSAIIRNESMSGQSQRAPFTDAIDSSPLMNESRSCRITLDSDPGGALVYLDGIYLGKTTPYTLDVGKGEHHTVRFELDGYGPSETSFTAANSTSIRLSLYATNAPGHTTKGQLKEIPEDPDGIRYGGLSIISRPNGAMISIDGIRTGKNTPSVIMGLKPGSHTVTLVQDLRNTWEKTEFVFKEQTVWVSPGVLIPVDIDGIGYHTFFEVIIDSRHYRGLPFTVNGYPLNATVPAKASAAQFDSFVTIYENESFITHTIPVIMAEDQYLLIEPRDYQTFTISVGSNPRGAEIFIDGFRTGYTTPYTFGNISDGPHRIMVTKDGYLPQQSLIYLPWGADPLYRKSVDFDLEEYQSGVLSVNSIPEGGKVTIDGLSTGGVTPALFKFIPIGTHSVKVTGTNTTKTFSDVTINSVEMTNLTADFTPPPED